VAKSFLTPSKTYEVDIRGLRPIKELSKSSLIIFKIRGSSVAGLWFSRFAGISGFQSSWINFLATPLAGAVDLSLE